MAACFLFLFFSFLMEWRMTTPTLEDTPRSDVDGRKYSTTKLLIALSKILLYPPLHLVASSLTYLIVFLLSSKCVVEPYPTPPK